MFSIETSEDVRILKELTSSSNDSRIQELELEVQKLSQVNNELLETSQQQKKVIDKIMKSLVTADQCKDIVFDLMNGSSKKEVITKRKRAKIGVPKPDTDEFDFAQVMKKKFNKILVEGNTLVHHTIKNQRMNLPISTIELLAFVEVYQYRKRKLLNKDYKNICKLFGINKVQFGRIYYNLKEGTFFNVLDEVNNQIKRTNFKFRNGKIYIIDGGNSIDTKIDEKLFNYLLNVYVNSDQPYSTIYKLSKEKRDINPIHLLAVLKRNEVVSKAITQSR